jgi:hypothetical protein
MKARTNRRLFEYRQGNLIMSEPEYQASSDKPPTGPGPKELRSTTWFMILSGLGFLAVGVPLKWLFSDWIIKFVAVLIFVGAMLLWGGIGALIYPSPEAMRMEPLDGSMVKTFQAMPLFWKIWYFLALVVGTGAGIWAVFWNF